MSEDMEAFQAALKFTLKWEGGAGHPADLAGKVYKGISQASYDTYRRNQKLPLQDVTKISDQEVEQLYYDMFWLPSRANTMVLPLAVTHFDTAVNFNVKGSFEFLQEAIGGLVVDGNFGPRSQAALAQNNNLATAQRYCQGRMDYRYQRVKANPSQAVFLDGWLLRDRDLLNYINQLAGVTTPTPTPTPSPLPSVNTAENQQLIAKVEQAMGLMQEVLTALKNRQ
jgi:lysozyme family protein